jgi:hypothetical protein
MDLSKLTGQIGNLFSKEALVNPVLLLALGFVSNIIVIAAGLASSEDGHKLVRVGARTIMDMEWKLRKSVNESPSQFDDKLLDEFIEACKEIEPGYVPVV